MTFKKIILCTIACYFCTFSFNTFALDQAAKEETSPPAEEGPLTAEQIPPINVPNQKNAVTPQQQTNVSPPQNSQSETQVMPSQ